MGKAVFKKRTLERMLSQYDSPDGVYDREAYLDYLTEQVGEQTPFADLLEEVDLSLENGVFSLILDDEGDVIGGENIPDDAFVVCDDETCKAWKDMCESLKEGAPPKKGVSKKTAKKPVPTCLFDIADIPF